MRVLCYHWEYLSVLQADGLQTKLRYRKTDFARTRPPGYMLRPDCKIIVPPPFHEDLGRFFPSIPQVTNLVCTFSGTGPVAQVFPLVKVQT